MTPKKNESRKAGTVALTGDLTITRAAEILSILKESLQANDEVRITLQDVSSVDLSCLQLLCSAHRTAAAAGQVLNLVAPVPEVLRQLIRQKGFKRQKNCAFSPKADCLCFDGEK